VLNAVVRVGWLSCPCGTNESYVIDGQWSKETGIPWPVHASLHGASKSGWRRASWMGGARDWWICPKHSADDERAMHALYLRGRMDARDASLEARLDAMVRLKTGDYERSFSEDEIVEKVRAALLGEVGALESA